MQKFIYGNLAIFYPRAIVSTSCGKKMLCKIVYFTRQRFARAIIDAETLRSLFGNINNNNNNNNNNNKGLY